MANTASSALTSNALTTQGDAGGQAPAAGPNRPASPLSFLDPNGRSVSIVEFFAADMGAHGGHMSVSNKDGSPADRAVLALASEISSAFVQGGASSASEASVAAALEGLDWNDFRRFTLSTQF